MSGFDRRSFLRTALGSSLAGAATSNLSPLHAFAAAAALPAAGPEKVLLIFLRGGLDGVLLGIPAGDPTYAAQRNLGALPPFISPTAAIGLTAFAATHPRMNWLTNSGSPWASNNLALLHQVGNPGGNRSHFTEMTRIESGDPSQPPNAFPEGFVPRWISGLGVSSALASATVSVLTQRLFLSSTNPQAHLRNPAAFRSRTFDPALITHLAATPTASTEALVDAIGDKMIAAWNEIQAAPPPAHDPVAFPYGAADPYPLVNPRGNEAVAFLRDLEGAFYLLENTSCRVAGVELGGFDTHENALQRLDVLIELLAFAMRSIWNRVTTGSVRLTTVAMTEFGRTARANGSNGADHGMGGVMLASGPRVLGGVYNCHAGGGLGATWSNLGTQFALPTSAIDWNAIPVRTHYLAVFSEMMSKLHGLSAAQIAAILPGIATAPPATMTPLNFL